MTKKRKLDLAKSDYSSLQSPIVNIPIDKKVFDTTSNATHLVLHQSDLSPEVLPVDLNINLKAINIKGSEEIDKIDSIDKMYQDNLNSLNTRQM